MFVGQSWEMGKLSQPSTINLIILNLIKIRHLLHLMTTSPFSLTPPKEVLNMKIKINEEASKPSKPKRVEEKVKSVKAFAWGYMLDGKLSKCTEISRSEARRYRQLPNGRYCKVIPVLITLRAPRAKNKSK